ncbi:F-actin capping protein alpha subunit-domain-containing protein [Hyaloraphidium curvatum]|nr:F-actin capping protein alpha subunit-domain-containing protein [Hyaloraphidium curvatum]
MDDEDRPEQAEDAEMDEAEPVEDETVEDAGADAQEDAPESPAEADEQPAPEPAPPRSASALKRAGVAADFLRAAPPGEFNDVYNDVRVLLGEDDDLDAEVLDAVATYNKEQLVVAAVDGLDHQVIVSEYNELDEVRFVDPKTRTTFAFDHLLHTTSDVEPPAEGDADDADDSARSGLEAAVTAYVQDHYPNGVSAVFAAGSELVIAIVDNKYNPGNYWNGRWRSVWKVPKEGAGKLRGKVQVQVHYYEDGNVQLETSRDVEVDFSPSSDPAQSWKSLVKLVSSSEAEFQASLNDTCAQLSDTTFKALRRALPVTKSKIEWTKLGGYTVGQEAAKR